MAIKQDKLQWISAHCWWIITSFLLHLYTEWMRWIKKLRIMMSMAQWWTTKRRLMVTCLFSFIRFSPASKRLVKVMLCVSTPRKTFGENYVIHTSCKHRKSSRKHSTKNSLLHRKLDNIFLCFSRSLCLIYLTSYYYYAWTTLVCLHKLIIVQLVFKSKKSIY